MSMLLNIKRLLNEFFWAFFSFLALWCSFHPKRAAEEPYGSFLNLPLKVKHYFVEVTFTHFIFVSILNLSKQDCLTSRLCLLQQITYIMVKSPRRKYFQIFYLKIFSSKDYIIAQHPVWLCFCSWCDVMSCVFSVHAPGLILLAGEGMESDLHDNKLIPFYPSCGIGSLSPCISEAICLTAPDHKLSVTFLSLSSPVYFLFF